MKDLSSFWVGINEGHIKGPGGMSGGHWFGISPGGVHDGTRVGKREKGDLAGPEAPC